MVTAWLPVVMVGVADGLALERACRAAGLRVRRFEGKAALELGSEPATLVAISERLCDSPTIEALSALGSERIVVVGGPAPAGSPLRWVEPVPEQVVEALKQASVATMARLLERHRDQHPEAQLILRGAPPEIVCGNGDRLLLARAPEALEALRHHARTADLLATGEMAATEGEIGLPAGEHGWTLLGFELTPLPGGRSPCFSLKLQDRRREWLASLQRDRSRRFDDLATLAGNLAHDFNNLLQVITTQSELIALDAEDAVPGLRSALQQIDRAAEQGTDLTRRVLAFSRARPLSWEVIDLRELAVEAIQTLVADRASRPAVKRCTEPATVTGDRVQLRQAIAELLRVIASERWDRVRLSVSRSLPLGVLHRGQRPRVRLTMSVPRPKDVALLGGEIMLDPLMSLDQQAVNADLGSAFAYRVLHAHGGRIRADVVHDDLVVRMDLPLTTAVRPAPHKGQAWKGGLLLVDDDPGVLAAGEALFERNGYETFTARNGDEALLLLERHGPSIALAIIDLIMPGMPAASLVLAMRARHRHIRIVLATGYGLGADTLPPVDGVLQKPFRIEDLERLTARVLTAGARTGEAGADEGDAPGKEALRS